MERVSYILNNVHRSLFPYLREVVGELSEKERRFVLVLEVVEIENHVGRCNWLGRVAKDRRALARAFVAKAYYNMPTTGELLGAFETGQDLSAIVWLGALGSGSQDQ